MQLTPTLYRQWALQGHQPLVPCPVGTHQKFHLFGALNAVSGKMHSRKASTINARHFRTFLKQVLHAYPREIVVVILDNAVWHRAKLLKPILLITPRLLLFFLPPYSPDLNPIELFWKGMRKAVTHNHCYQNLPELRSSLNLFFRRKGTPKAMDKIARLCEVC